MGLAVLLDHVKALLDGFGVFLGLHAVGEGYGGDVDATRKDTIDFRFIFCTHATCRNQYVVPKTNIRNGT